MDGVELARAIKDTEAGADLPLMLLSSLGSGESDEDLFVASLTKPVKQSSLFDSLVTLLGDQEPNAVAAAASHRRGDAGMGVRHPLRILIAEDNKTNQQLALLVLEKMGYRADVASNGLEAVHQATEHHYDVVLMDVQMPEMDGLDATRELIRRADGGPRPMIVAMTANAMQGDREECLAAGMDDYLSKPIRDEELAAALEKVPSGGRAQPTEGRPGRAPPAQHLGRRGRRDESAARAAPSGNDGVRREVVSDGEKAVQRALEPQLRRHPHGCANARNGWPRRHP